jgi:pimeloyl-ACP methyl ester carboxylesterase
MAVALSSREQTRARYPDESGDVERDGVRISYEVYGSGEPTVLLLPTWSIIHSRHWKAQIPYLARYFRVLTFDGRGNGRSDRPTDTDAYSEWEFAADALAVMDATATHKAVIVGLSLGVQSGLILAAEHPERVQAAIFIGPAYPGGGERLPARVGHSWEDELERDEGWAKYNKHVWLRDYPGFLDFFFRRMFTEPHSTKQIEDCVGWGLETTGEMLVTAQTAAKLTEKTAREVASRVRCPVLVIQGSEDAILSPTRGAACAEHTGGELVMLEGSGHGPHVRDPVQINLLLRDFIGRHA